MTNHPPPSIPSPYPVLLETSLLGMGTLWSSIKCYWEGMERPVHCWRWFWLKVCLFSMCAGLCLPSFTSLCESRVCLTWNWDQLTESRPRCTINLTFFSSLVLVSVYVWLHVCTFKKAEILQNDIQFTFDFTFCIWHYFVVNVHSSNSNSNCRQFHIILLCIKGSII